MTATASRPSRILDLGCGSKLRSGAIGIDFNSRSSATIIHNLNVFPYPLEAGAFDEVYLDNTLEHLDDVVRVMEELYRICSPNAMVKVIVPYFRSPWAFLDPTHKHFFTVESFGYFDPDSILCQRYDYSTARFALQKVVFNETLENGWLKRQVVKLANRWPTRYEYYLSQFYWLDDVSFYLRRV